MTEHSKLAPSSAFRRMACPGSRAMEAQCPNTSTSSSREGDAAHWVASQFVGVAPRPRINDLTPAGDIVTQEMIKGAELYHEYIINGLSGKIIIKGGVEEKLDLSFIHPECFGTPDYWQLSKTAAPSEHLMLDIYDYKFGRTPVEVFENWQLIAYSAGVVNNPNWDILSITFHIVQPRAYHPDGVCRAWSITRTELDGYLKRLRMSESLAMTDDAPRIAGPQCKYCKARYACDTLKKAAEEAVKLSSAPVGFDLNPSDLSKELKILKSASEIIDARTSGLEEEALALILRGVRVPGFMAKEGRKNDKWIKPVEEIAYLGDLYNVKITKDPELITPTQAIQAGIPQEVINKYYIKPRGELKLAEDNNLEARKVFAID